MTAGSLSSMPGSPMGQTRERIVLLRNPELPEPLLEARPLRGAADEAHIGKAPPQGRRRDRHVEGMVVGHDQDEGVRAGLGDLGLRVPHADRLRVRRDMGRKSILPVVEPAHGERQGRQRQNERAAHMAGAEEENGRADLAMGLAPAGPAVVADGGGELAASRGPPPCGTRARTALLRPPPRTSGARSSRSRVSKVSIRIFTRPPQHWPRSGPSA